MSPVTNLARSNAVDVALDKFLAALDALCRISSKDGIIFYFIFDCIDDDAPVFFVGCQSM